MAEILSNRKKQTKTSFGERPDFNDFDKQVLGWDLSMSNSIDQEDTFVVRFAGLPSYNGSIVSLGQKVKLKFQNKEIDMIIRNIGQGKEARSETTTVTLGTAKIYLDTHLKKSVTFKAPTVSDFVAEIKNLTGINSKIDCHNIGSETIPVDKDASILPTQNVLDRLKAFLTNDKTGSKYTVWLDAFNVLNVDKDYPDHETIDLDYNELGALMLSCYR